ncbi:hypothetical protein ACROYT_G024977 [Oculina patagonica]
MSSKNAVTIGSLIEKDLKEAYFLLQYPSSYSKGYRFLNDKKYRLFDYPPSLRVSRTLSAFKHLPAAGNEIPIILECAPESYLQQHWKQWLPAFPPVVIKPSDEGLQDDIPLVTTAAFQGIPKHKHGVDPDILYEVQLKSSILDIKAPTPRRVVCHFAINQRSARLGGRDFVPRIYPWCQRSALLPFLRLAQRLQHDLITGKLVEKANGINKNGEGIVIVLSAANADTGCNNNNDDDDDVNNNNNNNKQQQCESFLCIFAKTPEMVQTLFHSMDN